MWFLHALCWQTSAELNVSAVRQIWFFCVCFQDMCTTLISHWQQQEEEVAVMSTDEEWKMSDAFISLGPDVFFLRIASVRGCIIMFTSDAIFPKLWLNTTCCFSSTLSLLHFIAPQRQIHERFMSSWLIQYEVLDVLSLKAVVSKAGPVYVPTS